MNYLKLPIFILFFFSAVKLQAKVIDFSFIQTCDSLLLAGDMDALKSRLAEQSAAAITGK